MLIRPIPEWLIPAVLTSLVACTNPKSEESKSFSTNQQETLTGLALSKQYCQSCHLYPEPQLLNKSTWKEYILPRMGYILGMYENDSVRSTLFKPGIGGE